MLDMSLMRGVWVDRERRIARAQAGCLLGDVDRVTERMRRYAEAGISTLTVAPWGKDAAARMQALEVAVEAHGRLVADGSIPAPAGASS